MLNMFINPFKKEIKRVFGNLPIKFNKSEIVFDNESDYQKAIDKSVEWTLIDFKLEFTGFYKKFWHISIVGEMFKDSPVHLKKQVEKTLKMGEELKKSINSKSLDNSKPKIKPKPIKVFYKNYKKEFSIRTILIKNIYYGYNEYHPTNQYLIEVWDCEKEMDRTFALNDCDFRSYNG